WLPRGCRVGSPAGTADSQPRAFGGELGDDAPIQLAFSGSDGAQQLSMDQARGGQRDFELIGGAQRESQIFESQFGFEARVLVVALGDLGGVVLQDQRALTE